MKVVDLFILGQTKERFKCVCYNRIIKDFLENTFGPGIEIDEKRIKSFKNIKLSFGQCWIIVDPDCNLLPVYADVPDKMMIMLVDVSVLALTSLGNEKTQDIKLLNSYLKNNCGIVLGEDIEEPDLEKPIKPTPFLKEVLKNSTVFYEKDKEQETVENLFIKLIDELIEEKTLEEKGKTMESSKSGPVVTKVDENIVDIKEPVVLVTEPELVNNTVPEQEVEQVPVEIPPVVEAEVVETNEPSVEKEETPVIAEEKPDEVNKELEEPVKINDKPEQVKITVRLDENNKAKVETEFKNAIKPSKGETKPVIEEKLDEKVKEETQVLGNDSSSDAETNESQTFETRRSEDKDVVQGKQTQQIIYEVISPEGEVIYKTQIQNAEPMTVEQILMQSGLVVKNTAGFIEAINGVQNIGMSGWVFEVNNAPVMVPASEYVVNPTDQITWKYVDFSKMMPDTETEKHI